MSSRRRASFASTGAGGGGGGRSSRRNSLSFAADPGSRRGSMAASRRNSGIAMGVSVRRSSTAEGVEYADRDMQVPMFSAGNVVHAYENDKDEAQNGAGGTNRRGSMASRRGSMASRRGSVASRRRSSVASVQSSDSMARIVDDPQLWKEFQTKMKESGNAAGGTANTREVLRKFISDKGLDREDEDEDDKDEEDEKQGQNGQNGHDFEAPAGRPLRNVGGRRRSSLFSLGSIHGSGSGSNMANDSTDSLDIDDDDDDGGGGVGGMSLGASLRVVTLSAKMIAQASSSSRRGSIASSAGGGGGIGGGNGGGRRRSSGVVGNIRRSSIISLGSQADCLDEQLERLNEQNSIDVRRAESRRRSSKQDVMAGVGNGSVIVLPKSLLTAMQLEQARNADRERRQIEEEEEEEEEEEDGLKDKTNQKKEEEEDEQVANDQVSVASSRSLQCRNSVRGSRMSMLSCHESICELSIESDNNEDEENDDGSVDSAIEEAREYNRRHNDIGGDGVTNAPIPTNGDAALTPSPGKEGVPTP